MAVISVIVPVYNTEPYLERCIESIRNQSINDIEIMLVNDGSTDTSGEICDRYMKTDSRIRVIHKTNGGLSSARNAGMDASTGDYLAFVDSDDFIEYDMYERMIEACDRHDAEIAISGRFDHKDGEISLMFTEETEIRLNTEQAIERLLTWDGIDSSACDKLFKRQVFKDIRFPCGKYNEDVFVMTMVLARAEGIVHIGAPMYHYVHREKSITSQSFNHRKMDLLDATTAILGFVKREYPRLTMKARCFHTKGILYLYPLLLRSNWKEDRSGYETQLRQELLENLVIILFGKDFSLKERITAILLFSGLYLPFYKWRYVQSDT